MDKRAKIVSHIVSRNKERFRAIDNTGESRRVVAGQFPDVILMRKEPPPNSDTLYLMKVETGEDLINSLPAWQVLASTPSVLYVVVPKERRDEASRLISVTGTNARIATYEMNGDEVKAVAYE